MDGRRVLAWRGRKILVWEATRATLRQILLRGEAVVFDLANEPEVLRVVCERARNLGLSVWGWIEVGRDEAAAEAHPEWMHLPQHHEWLEAFPEWEASAAGAIRRWWLPGSA